jgi:hypothetical protein
MPKKLKLPQSYPFKKMETFFTKSTGVESNNSIIDSDKDEITQNHSNKKQKMNRNKEPLRDISNNSNNRNDTNDMSQKNESSSSSTSPSPHSLIRSSNKDDETSSTKKLLSTATSSSSTSSSTSSSSSSSSSNEKHGLDINDNGDDIVETDINSNSSTETELKNLIKQQSKRGWMWIDSFDKFKEYIRSNGGHYPTREHFLGKWVNRTRYDHTSNKLSIERNALLNLIGFRWTAQTKSEFIGVTQNKKGLFQAKIIIGGKSKHIKTCKLATEAARAYDQEAIKLGKKLNFSSDEVYEAARKKEIDQNNKERLERWKLEKEIEGMSWKHASDEDKKKIMLYKNLVTSEEWKKISSYDSSKEDQDRTKSVLLDGLTDLQPDDILYVAKYTSKDNKPFENEHIAATYQNHRNPLILNENGESFSPRELKNPESPVYIKEVMSVLVLNSEEAYDGESFCIEYLREHLKATKNVLLNQGCYGGSGKDNDSPYLHGFGVIAIRGVKDALMNGSACLNSDASPTIKNELKMKMGPEVQKYFVEPCKKIKDAKEKKRKYEEKRTRAKKNDD